MEMFMLLYKHSYLTLSLKIDFPVLISAEFINLVAAKLWSRKGISSWIAVFSVFYFNVDACRAPMETSF